MRPLCWFPANSLQQMGQAIKQSRERAKISQRALGAHLGVSEVFICRVESGAKPLPDSYLSKVTEKLDIDLEKMKEMKLAYYKEVMEYEISNKSA